MRRPRPHCHLFGCDWHPVSDRDAKQCCRCDAVMSALDVISFWRAETVIPAAFVYAATGKRLTDHTLLSSPSYGWPLVAPRRFRP